MRKQLREMRKESVKPVSRMRKGGEHAIAHSDNRNGSLKGKGGGNQR
jgi:hypothetical protein